MRRRRVLVILCALVLGDVAVLWRLGRLQVVETDMWLRESQRSTMRFASRPCERGWIFDRHGEPLALTQSVRDLVFRYRDWRRETVAGQVSHAWWTLNEPRFGVVASLAAVEGLATALGSVTIGEIAALATRQQRLDLGFYLERIFGPELWDGVRTRLRDEQRDGSRTLSSLPGFEAGLAAATERALLQLQALAAVAELAHEPLDVLLDRMDRAIRTADRRVQKKLNSETMDERGEYKLLQQLHIQFDDEPTLLVRGVPYDVQTMVAIRGPDLGGLEVRLEQRRSYAAALADVAPLLVGRVGKPLPADIDAAEDHRRRLADLASLRDMTAEELDEYERLRVQVRETDYAYGDERGVFGVEAALEEVLRGKRGWYASSVGVDQVITEQAEPQRGANVTLTIDVDLQLACQDVLDSIYVRPPAPNVSGGDDVPPHWSGAIVLLDPRNGEILALASGPRPTREELTGGLGSLLFDDPEQRVRHRGIDPGATGNLPPPGSTFKPVSALAGLASGTLAATTSFFCDGGLDAGDRRMGCLGFHGDVDLHEALAKSCNVYFYELGRRVGAEPLREMAERFGFGERSGLLMGNQALRSIGVAVGSGVHESDPRIGPRPDSVTDAMRLAIGQAPLDDCTPLQVASMMAAVATGIRRPPVLIRSIEGRPALPSREPVPLDVHPRHLEAVRRGLAEVMETGTGSALREHIDDELPWLAGALAAKTGTAEVDGLPDHSWFVGYLPRDEPRLAFAVLIEHVGLHGNEAALPTFSRLLHKPAMEVYLRRHVLSLPWEPEPRR